MNEANDSLGRLAAATSRLLATATALSDAQVREPSSLPGWTRGHVLTHIARVGHARSLFSVLGSASVPSLRA